MPPKVNTPTIQIAQPGFDVRKCPDWAYLFNGNWPNLAIVYEKTVTVSGNMTLTHNLGYPPLVMAWRTANGVSYGRQPSVEVDPTHIFLNSMTGTFTLRGYNIDISKEASYPLPQSANAKLPYNDQFGAKIPKANRLITSKNLNDFILHTRAQSPAVLEVATENGPYFKISSNRNYWPYGNIPPGGWYLIVYPLKTDYIPWYAGGLNQGSKMFTLAYGQQIYYDSTDNCLVLNITSTGSGSLIVLRDPLFYPNVVQVTY